MLLLLSVCWFKAKSDLKKRKKAKGKRRRRKRAPRCVFNGFNPTIYNTEIPLTRRRWELYTSAGAMRARGRGL